MKHSYKEPLVSVIVPTYNRRDLIGEALNSVLSQTYRNIEIVIVDDGSSDNTKEYVEKSFGDFVENGTIKYYYISHSGISNSRNVGIEKASGSLLAFIDSDDVWDRDKLKLQVDYLREHPDCLIVGTHFRNFFCGSRDQLSRESLRILNGVRSDLYFASFCCRRKVFESYGLLDISMRTGEDTEWIFRAKGYGCDIKVIERELYYRRVHNQNISCNDEFRTEAFHSKILLKACHNILKLKAENSRESDSRTDSGKSF